MARKKDIWLSGRDGVTLVVTANGRKCGTGYFRPDERSILVGRGYIEKFYGGPFPVWIITDRGFEYLREWGVTDRNISILRDKRDVLVGDHFRRRVKGRRVEITVSLPRLRRTIAVLIFGATAVATASTANEYHSTALGPVALPQQHLNKPEVDIAKRHRLERGQIEIAKHPRLKDVDIDLKKRSWPKKPRWKTSEDRTEFTTRPRMKWLWWRRA